MPTFTVLVILIDVECQMYEVPMCHLLQTLYL